MTTPLGCSEHLGWYWATSFGDGVVYPMDPNYTDTAHVRCVLIAVHFLYLSVPDNRGAVHHRKEWNPFPHRC